MDRWTADLQIGIRCTGYLLVYVYSQIQFTTKKQRNQGRKGEPGLSNVPLCIPLSLCFFAVEEVRGAVGKPFCGPLWPSVVLINELVQ